MEDKEQGFWIQKFSNYNRALIKLNAIVEYYQERTEEIEGILEEVTQLALIQSFEYTHELAWKVMKDYAKY